MAKSTYFYVFFINFSSTRNLNFDQQLSGCLAKARVFTCFWAPNTRPKKDRIFKLSGCLATHPPKCSCFYIKKDALTAAQSVKNNVFACLLFTIPSRHLINPSTHTHTLTMRPSSLIKEFNSSATSLEITQCDRRTQTCPRHTQTRPRRTQTRSDTPKHFWFRWPGKFHVPDCTRRHDSCFFGPGAPPDTPKRAPDTPKHAPDTPKQRFC